MAPARGYLGNPVALDTVQNDISTVVSRVPSFLAEVEAVVSASYPDFEIVWYGHIGDGNLHLNVLKPDGLAMEEFQRRCGEVSKQVFEIVQRHGGSISAEHGVGLLKRTTCTTAARRWRSRSCGRSSGCLIPRGF